MPNHPESFELNGVSYRLHQGVSEYGSFYRYNTVRRSRGSIVPERRYDLVSFPNGQPEVLVSSGDTHFDFPTPQIFSRWNETISACMNRAFNDHWDSRVRFAPNAPILIFSDRTVVGLFNADTGEIRNIRIIRFRDTDNIETVGYLMAESHPNFRSCIRFKHLVERFPTSGPLKKLPG